MLTRKSSDTLWCCTDCYVTLDGSPSEEPTDPEPMSLLSDTDVVTAGMVDDEHSEDCPRDVTGECECERREFSKASCRLCGIREHGARYAVTVWFVDQP